MKKMERKNIKIGKLFQHKHLNIKIWADDIPIDQKVADYEVEDLRALRERLNDTKNKMDRFYIGSKTDKTLSKRWNALQSTVDIYRPMRKYIQDQFNAQLVTNAWMKYYEIYSQYDLMPATGKVMAFFNAELPGAALCAFNHYMCTLRPNMAFDWRASSLAPDNATGSNTDVLGDYYGLYEKNKDKWLMQLKSDVMGATATPNRRNNGDATDIENLHDFASRIGPKSPIGGVDIYSHDAGIDVSESAEGGLGFNQQEIANARIHLGCALAGFMTLKPGGAFIAKQYTYFETFTWNLILIYSSMFEEFYICKPLTSRPYNSEIYLVGKGFKGMSDKIEKILVDRLVNFNTSPFIPKDGFKIVLSQPYADLLRFARIIFGQQIQFIDENLEFFARYGENSHILARGIEWVKEERRNFWLKAYPMRRIETALWIPQRDKHSETSSKSKNESTSPDTSDQ